MFLEFENSVEETNDHGLWVEKYRPSKIEDFVGLTEIKDTVSSYIERKDVCNLMLHSKSPGTGKTSISKIIVKSIPCDHLYINASDENSVDTVRDKIKSFASSLGFNPLKICILDESDHLTVQGQAALRNIIETYSKHCRFIFTCNYVDRIITPLLSRCQVFEVIPPSKKDIAIHLIKILGKENVSFDKNDIAFLVNKYYPDIRKILNTAQQSSFTKQLVLNKQHIIDNDVKLKIVELLKVTKNSNDTFREARQLVADAGTSDYSEWFTTLYNHVDDFAKDCTANVICCIAEHQYKSAFVADKEINFSACIIDILKYINKK